MSKGTISELVALYARVAPKATDESLQETIRSVGTSQVYAGPDREAVLDILYEELARRSCA